MPANRNAGLRARVAVQGFIAHGPEVHDAGDAGDAGGAVPITLGTYDHVV